MSTLIRGGILVDGSAGCVPAPGDVLVEADRITTIGDLSARDADHVVDAAGLVVTPGFIDPHTHVETAILERAPAALAPLLQGVTTVLTAPDGFGWAPLSAPEAAALWTSTVGIHGPRPEAMPTDTVASYLDALAEASPVNVLPQAPGAAIRFAAMGWSSGPASPRQAARMRDHLVEWLDAGATGLAVGLDYEPGSRASEAELIGLCRVVAEHGGSIAAHMRGTDAGRVGAYEELGRIGAATGVRVNIAHERLDDEGAAALASVAGMADVAFESYLYAASSTQLASSLPGHLRAGGPAAIAARVSSAATRPEVEQALAATIAARHAVGGSVVFAASADGSRVGREIGECAAAAGRPIGAYAADCLVDDPTALFVFHHGGADPDAIFARTIRHPAMMVASDGIYVGGRMHPRGYGTFPRVLRRWVREAGVISLPDAVHRMTGLTAERYRVPDRGRLAPGAIADIVVFDPDTIADGATWESPTAAPTGVVHVLVNGHHAVVDGRPTAARAGRVLRAGAPTPG